MYMWCFLLQYSCSYALISFVSAEIITLLREKSVTCVVTEDTVASAVYITPPIKSDFDKSINEMGSWLIDDWRTINSTDSYQNIVTDKRWEDFKMFDESIGYALKNNPLSFSVCISENTIFTIFNADFLSETAVPFALNDTNWSRKGNTCKWSHYILIKNGSTIQFISEENTVRTYEFDFDPYWIYFGNSFLYNTFWKIHKYDFRVSTIPTQDEKSTISVTFSENLCLSMYVSIDKDCFLDVILPSNNEAPTKTIIGFNQPNSLKEWRKVQIEAEHPGQQNLSFFRGRVQSGNDGYWAIDKITFCDKEMEIYEAFLDEDAPELHAEQYECAVLDKFDYVPDISEENILTCNKPGLLGEQCSISCNTVVGPSYPFCENYTICQKAFCVCSWGHQGPKCDKTCDEGKWGLFCKNKCKTECPLKCDPSTGDCLKTNTNSKRIDTKIDVNYRGINITSNERTLTTDGTAVSDFFELLHEEYFLKNITTSSNKVYLYLPNIKESRNLTYEIKYLCANTWCYNKIIQNETISANTEKTVIVSKLRSSLPVTNYKIIVEIQALNESLEKTYVAFKEKYLFNISDFSVYCSNSSTLWVRFLNNNMKSAAYKIWYYEQNAMLEPKNFVTPSHCPISQMNICGKIENLKKDTNYTIMIEAIKTQYQEWGLSEAFSGLTTERAPQGPENLKITWSSKYETILNWDYPSVTNGPLQKFVVNVENVEGIVNHTIHISTPQKTYRYKLSLNYNSDYTISVSAFNKFEGEKSTVRVLFHPINPTFSCDNSFMMEVCITKCYWIVPKPSSKSTRYNYYKIVGIPGVETNDNILQHFKKNNQPDGNEKGWIILNDTSGSDKFSSVEIDTKLDIQDLLNYSFYYVVEDTTDDEYSVYPIRIPKEEIKMLKPLLPALKLATSAVVIIAIAIILTLLLLILLFLRLQELHKPKKNFDHVGYRLEQRKLLDDAHDNATKIDTNILEQYLKNILVTGKELIIQFRSVPAATRPIVHAFQNKNKNKNKDCENVPYDYNRVALEKLEGMGTDDYINASYISGLDDRPKTYIATQGPKFSTLKDFWRMIWQEQVETIVMAANFTESKKRKCAEYFPLQSNGSFECGEMLIKLISEEVYEHYIARVLEISHREIRKIQHFQLTWNPDDFSPFYANCIVPLTKRISAIREKTNTPIVIHCSSGVNRVGTLILCDLAIQMSQTTDGIDFYTLLKKLRDQRPNMICSEKQYILAHLVVLECLMEQEGTFKQPIKDNHLSVLKNQLNYLKRLSWHDDVVHSWSPRSGLYNYLCSPADGYRTKRKFLTTQQPTNTSLHTFWTMSVQEKILIIVLLNKEKDLLWPYYHPAGSTLLSVKELHSIRTTYCTVTTLLLSVVQMSTNTVILEQKIHVFQAHNYDRCLNLNNTDDFLNIVEDINKNYYNQMKPILVVCHDGVTNCGVFLALDYVTEKWKKECEIDICNAVRIIRRSGVPFIKTTVEMQFLYKAVEEYLQKYDAYTCIM